jgi:hypothetical protein
MPRTLITGAAQSVTEKTNQSAQASKSKQPRGRTADKVKDFGQHDKVRYEENNKQQGVSPKQLVTKDEGREGVDPSRSLARPAINPVQERHLRHRRHRGSAPYRDASNNCDACK